MRKTYLLLALSSLFMNFVHAQIDTINAANKTLLVSKLKPSKSTYLVYTTDSVENKRNVGDIWERIIRFSKRNSTNVVEFDWKWLHNDSLFAHIVSICDAKTLSPIYHYADYKSRGVYAFDYHDGFMIPSDTIKNNLAKKKGKTKLDLPVISWEEDLELLPLLPIRYTGQKFDIAFFDPNEKMASYHRYEVVGQEKLQLNSDISVKCWLVKIDYAPGSYAQFWLSNFSKEVLKMKEFYNGSYRVKVRQY